MSEHWKKNLDKPLIFFILFSAAVCVESYKLGVGTFNKPRSGFFPLLLGAVIGTLAVILQLIRLFSKGRDTPKVFVPFKRIVPLGVSLFAYVLLIQFLGFVIATVLLVVFFLKIIESLPWKVTAPVAIGIPFLTYFIFRILLRIQLPTGFMGF
jgi:putative tricarboxylic transport membrane protein